MAELILEASEALNAERANLIGASSNCALSTITKSTGMHANDGISMACIISGGVDELFFATYMLSAAQPVVRCRGQKECDHQLVLVRALHDACNSRCNFASE